MTFGQVVVNHMQSVGHVVCSAHRLSGRSIGLLQDSQDVCRTCCISLHPVKAPVLFK